MSEKNDIRWIKVSDDDRAFYGVGSSGDIYAWDAVTGARLTSVPGEHLESVRNADKIDLVQMSDHASRLARQLQFDPNLKLGLLGARLLESEDRLLTWGWDDRVRIWSTIDRQCLAELPFRENNQNPRITLDGEEATLQIGYPPLVAMTSRGHSLMTSGYKNPILLWHRRRPEYWWGVAWLPEFWLTVVLSVGLAVSVWRDQQSLRQTA